jgi:hypothetical protein
MDHKRPDELMGSALEEAVSSGKVEVVKKIGIDPTRDDPSSLLAQCWLCEQPSLVEMLLDAGADPNRGEGEHHPMRSLMRGFEWTLDPIFGHRSPEGALQCVLIAGRRGGRWCPDNGYDRTSLRRSLAKAEPHRAISYLNQMIDAGVFTREVFRELMNTPRMRELLATSASGALRVREFAGVPSKGGRPHARDVQRRGS